MREETHVTVLEKVTEGMSSPLPSFFLRDLSLGSPQAPAVGNLVNLIAGVRRCGKTYRLYQEMQALLEAGVQRKLMLYFNFDDERLLPSSSEVLDDVISTYEELCPQALDGCYLFFDEIQEIPQWGVFLRRLVDTRKATVYVTGSSSRMLSSEMPTEFRGRAITRELFPLSFREFCRVKGFGVGQGPHAAPEAFSSAEKARLKNLLGDYLVRGGFPATLELARQDAFQVLQGYVSQTVARDIIEREGLGNARAAQAFARRCIASSARELSISKTAGQFKALGMPVARESLSRLLGYYEESYLVFRLMEQSRSLSPNPKSASKVYAVDPGLEAAFSPASTADCGQRLETAVFNALRRRCGYLREGALSRVLADGPAGRYEVDFAVGDVLLDEPVDLYQACASLDDRVTLAREVSALEVAMQRFGRDESWIIAGDSQRDIPCEHGTVHVVPAWSWLLA